MRCRAIPSLSAGRPYVSQPPRRQTCRASGVFMTTTNGGPGQTAAQDTQPPQLTVVSQYIKDFSFENPNAPQSLAPRQEQPQIGIQINVAAKPLSKTGGE